MISLSPNCPAGCNPSIRDEPPHGRTRRRSWSGWSRLNCLDAVSVRALDERHVFQLPRRCARQRGENFMSGKSSFRGTRMRMTSVQETSKAAGSFTRTSSGDKAARPGRGRRCWVDAGAGGGLECHSCLDRCEPSFAHTLFRRLLSVLARVQAELLLECTAEV